MTDNRKEQFHRAMIAVYQNALRECTERAAFFLEMVGRQGGVETAKKLLQPDDESSGPSALLECERPHLMFEYLILQPQYAELFTGEEKEMARQRLKKCGYSL